MMRVKEIQATFVAVATFLIRPVIFLILGLAIGYGLGYTDAFREADTLGNRVARKIYQLHPDALSEGVRQRASTIRDTTQTRFFGDTIP